MGRHLWPSGVVAILALAFLLTTGCSWLFVNKPYQPIYATAPAECTFSVAAPVIDTLVTGLLAGAGVVAIVYANQDANNHPDSYFSGLNALPAAGGAVLILSAVPFAISAAYGYETTSACRRMTENRKLRVTQLSCVGGLEASWGGWGERNGLSHVIGSCPGKRLTFRTARAALYAPEWCEHPGEGLRWR